MRSLTPFLWFDDDLEEAVDFYSSVFDDVQVHHIDPGPEGTAFIGEISIGGQRLRLLNGGPMFTFTEAISLFVECDDQAEVDRYWSALTADGGEESRCGWCKDRFGLSWQIIPAEFMERMRADDTAAVARMTAAMLTMGKLDMAALRAAFDGTG